VIEGALARWRGCGWLGMMEGGMSFSRFWVLGEDGRGVGGGVGVLSSLAGRERQDSGPGRARARHRSTTFE